MNIKLVKLSYEYKEQLIDMLDEWIEYNNTHKEANHSPWAILYKNDYHDFDNYLNNLEYKNIDAKAPYVTKLDERVDNSVFFCLDLDRNIFVGGVDIRHSLNQGLLETGGHIGDGIRPTERGKGYATAMLGLAIEECRKLGLKRVLLCCDKTNIGSKKHIIANGGIYENDVLDDGAIEERYWIELDSNNYIEGENIVLRKARIDDFPRIMHIIWSDPRVYEFMWFRPTFDLEEGKARMMRTINFQAILDAYFIVLKDTDEVIGLCGINKLEEGIYQEIGICIGCDYQNKGYGTETLKLLLDLAFNKYNAKEFQYALMKKNEKSRALKDKFNFKYLKTTLETRPWDNKECEMEFFRLSKDDYK